MDLYKFDCQLPTADRDFVRDWRSAVGRLRSEIYKAPFPDKKNHAFVFFNCQESVFALAFAKAGQV